jgi:hypothetical protein
VKVPSSRMKLSLSAPIAGYRCQASRSDGNPDGMGTLPPTLRINQIVQCITRSGDNGVGVSCGSTTPTMTAIGLSRPMPCWG